MWRGGSWEVKSAYREKCHRAVLLGARWASGHAVLERREHERWCKAAQNFRLVTNISGWTLERLRSIGRRNTRACHSERARERPREALDGSRLHGATGTYHARGAISAQRSNSAGGRFAAFRSPIGCRLSVCTIHVCRILVDVQF